MGVAPGRVGLMGLASLAVVLAVALAYASVELPVLVSGWMMDVLDFPGFDSGREIEATEAFLAARSLRPVGFAALASTLLLMAVGLVMERRGAAFAGAVVFFLPVFGHFAASMFFLAGLGALRIAWLPILDISYGAMALADVAYLPYAALVWLAALIGLDLRDVVAWVAMIAGLAVFAAAVLAWFVARGREDEVVDFWVYRLSRHPQYVGWILWSWGLMVYVGRHSQLYQFKISWGVGSSLPWAVSTAVVVGVALLEELRMHRGAGAAYEAYRRHTPFLLPLPRGVSEAIAAPMRCLLRAPWPRTGTEVAIVVALYLVLAVVLSLPIVLTGWPGPTGWWGFPHNVWPFAD